MNGLSFYSAIPFPEPHICTKFSSSVSSYLSVPSAFSSDLQTYQDQRKRVFFQVKQSPSNFSYVVIEVQLASGPKEALPLLCHIFYQKAYLILPSTSRCSTTKGLQMIQIATWPWKTHSCPRTMYTSAYPYICHRSPNHASS